MTPATLGASGLAASRLGLGLAAVGRPGYITLGRAADLPDRTPDALAARTSAVLDAAWAAGVRYVDVARSYGRGEEFLARWLRARDVAAGAVTVGSKWGYRYIAGWRVDAPVHEEKELSVERFRAQLAETRALLGERLSLYQIHSATPEAVSDARLLGALVAGRRSRAYRAVGVTLSGPDSARTLERALAARVDGGRVFDVVQATFNCLEPSLAGPLAAAHASGVGVIVKEALANGRLTDTNTRPEDEHLLRTLRAATTRRGDDVSRFALAFVLEQPWVDVVLSGAATTSQLTSNVAALDVTLDDVGRAILASVAEPSSRYWATRASLAWT